MDSKDHGEVFLKYQYMFIVRNFSLCMRLWWKWRHRRL